MNEFLHREFDLGADQVVEVHLDHPANVQLLDPSNYGHYVNGRPYRYYGGYVQRPPWSLRAPHPGRWHLVIDLGGGPGIVRASVRVLGAPKASAS